MWETPYISFEGWKYWNIKIKFEMVNKLLKKLGKILKYIKISYIQEYTWV